jgi:hypothetical protein
MQMISGMFRAFAPAYAQESGSVHDFADCFSPAENGEIIKPDLYSLRTRISNNRKFTNIDPYGAPVSGISLLANLRTRNAPDGAASSRPLFGCQRLQS